MVIRGGGRKEVKSVIELGIKEIMVDHLVGERHRDTTTTETERSEVKGIMDTEAVGGADMEREVKGETGKTKKDGLEVTRNRTLPVRAWVKGQGAGLSQVEEEVVEKLTQQVTKSQQTVER